MKICWYSPRFPNVSAWWELSLLKKIHLRSLYEVRGPSCAVNDIAKQICDISWIVLLAESKHESKLSIALKVQVVEISMFMWHARRRIRLFSWVELDNTSAPRQPHKGSDTDDDLTCLCPLLQNVILILQEQWLYQWLYAWFYLFLFNSGLFPGSVRSVRTSTDNGVRILQ